MTTIHRMLRLANRELETVRQHSIREYPNECCGILLGTQSHDSKQVTEAVPLRNLRVDPVRAQELLPLESDGESERNRFLIDPQDQIRVEKDARARGLEVVGYYHSHPDHPARPSKYDRDHAWPWYSYVIVSVERGNPTAVTSWVLAEDRNDFRSEEIDLNWAGNAVAASNPLGNIG